MNLPTKITVSRIILTILIVILLVFPFESAGITMLTIFVNELLVINVKYLIAGVLFIIASITDLIDGKIARKKNMVTESGKILDAIADKLLFSSVLIILSSQGFIHPIIPVIIIARDSIVDILKMSIGLKDLPTLKLGKAKTLLLMLGISLTLFYNLPFELWNLRIADMALIIATALSIVSGFDYYNKYKEYKKVG